MQLQVCWNIWPFSGDLNTFTEEIFNGWIHFLCSAMAWYFFHGMNVSIYWWQYYLKSGYIADIESGSGVSKLYCRIVVSKRFSKFTGKD